MVHAAFRGYPRQCWGRQPPPMTLRQPGTPGSGIACASGRAACVGRRRSSSVRRAGAWNRAASSSCNAVLVVPTAWLHRLT